LLEFAGIRVDNVGLLVHSVEDVNVGFLEAFSSSQLHYPSLNILRLQLNQLVKYILALDINIQTDQIDIRSKHYNILTDLLDKTKQFFVVLLA
jgi:hypothetical protein